MMKTLRYMTALCAVLMLTACGGDGGSGEYVPQTWSMELTLSSDAVTQTIELSQFSTAIQKIDGITSWLVVTKETPGAGAPSIKVTATENLTLSERKANITVTAANGDKVIFNVTQKAHPAETNTGVEDPHGNISDQPAYAPVR